MMDQLRRGNKELMKELNRALVINQVRLNGPISRTDIAKNTDLGLSTITNIVDELQQERLIYEVGSGTSSGGRKPVLLKFNEDYGFVVGIKIEKDRMLFCASNLNAKIKDKSQVTFSRNADAEVIKQLMIREIEKMINHSQENINSAFLGVGIAVSGLVDQENKRVIYSPILMWENFSFRFLSEYFDVPVFMDNDANVFALAEMWVGKGKDYSHFIGVTVGSGIGAGIVIDSKLYRGDFGGAGELGHIVIQREGVPCHCGQRGCLEVYASDSYIISEGQRLRALGVSSGLTECDTITPEMICSAAINGDKYAQEILVKQGENLGIGIKNMVNLFNPAAIILGGEGLRAQEYLLEGVHKELATHFFTKHDQQLRVHVSSLGEDVWLVGACSLVVSDLFKAPIYK